MKKKKKKKKDEGNRESCFFLWCLQFCSYFSRQEMMRQPLQALYVVFV